MSDTQILDTSASPVLEYRGQIITILKDTVVPDGLVFIQDSTGEEFWVKKSKLVPRLPRAARTPVYVSYAVPTSIAEFVSFLQTHDYTLSVICRNEIQVEQVQLEYAAWTDGQELPESAIRRSFDGSMWDREWFLIFCYAPGIDYPFAILERGTGGNRRSPEPVAWHRKGTIESCYAAIAELVIRAGLKARY